TVHSPAGWWWRAARPPPACPGGRPRASAAPPSPGPPRPGSPRGAGRPRTRTGAGAAAPAAARPPRDPPRHPPYIRLALSIEPVRPGMRLRRRRPRPYDNAPSWHSSDESASQFLGDLLATRPYGAPHAGVPAGPRRAVAMTTRWRDGSTSAFA